MAGGVAAWAARPRVSRRHRSLSDGTVMLWLTVSTAIAVPIAPVAFSWFMTRARQAGLLDMTTGS